MFRKAGEHFANVAEASSKLVTNSEWTRLAPLYEHIESPLKGDASHLVVLYEQMLADLADRRPARVTAKTHRVTVEQVIAEMKAMIEEVRFSLLQGLYPKLPSRYSFVAHLLAMLQLVRDGELNIHQETMMGPIWMYRKDLTLEEIQGDIGETHLNQPQIDLGNQEDL
jgi:segregation and condensation protein A